MLPFYRLWRFSPMAVQANTLQEDLPRAAWLAFTQLSSSFLYLKTLQVCKRHSMSFEAKNLLQYVNYSLCVRHKAS